ncbi:MAG: ParB/RepB/Spo0J family partition protein [Bacteroidales bacterium]|nr:ParB/RepB/Spo0J family partition protein [Bacteroidales bacterium]
MSKEPRGLGRGLNALLGDHPDIDRFRKPVGYVNKEIAGSQPRQDTADVLRIPVEMVEANPYQPRLSFDPEAMAELAASIRSLGLIQPITVRRVGEKRYQIISGERRFKACQMAGMTMIPAYVRDADDQGMLEMALVENLQREDLDPIETALSFQRLIEECHLTQEAMADRVGKKRSSVTNTLRLLRLPVKVQHDLKVGLLDVGHAKVLLGVDDPALQEQLCDRVVRDSLSVRQLEELLRSVRRQGADAAKKEIPLPEDCRRLVDRVGSFFPQGVSLRRNASGKGTMTIRFDSDEQLRAFLGALDAQAD